MTTTTHKWWNDQNLSTSWPATQNVVTIGTMFSGLDSYVRAMTEIPIRHCFAIESDPFCCKVLRATLQPELLLQQDVTKINVNLLPHVDLFCASPPCTPYSSIGRQAPEDPRCDLIQPVIDYIVSRTPSVVVVENVVKFRDSTACRALRRCLLQNSYTVQVKVLDSSEFGSPQKRKRLFLVAVASQCRSQRIPWPHSSQLPPRSLDMAVLEPVEELPSTVWLTPKAIEYLERRREWGSRVFTRDHISTMPTFCKSYGHQTHWKHTIQERDGRLRNLTSREVARLMDLPDTFPVDIVSKTQTLYQLGNAICLSVLRPLLKNLSALILNAKSVAVRIERIERTFRFRS
jgi:DNA-cytosine methyltransferase